MRYEEVARSDGLCVVFGNDVSWWSQIRPLYECVNRKLFCARNDPSYGHKAHEIASICIALGISICRRPARQQTAKDNSGSFEHGCDGSAKRRTEHLAGEERDAICTSKYRTVIWISQKDARHQRPRSAVKSWHLWRWMRWLAREAKTGAGSCLARNKNATTALSPAPDHLCRLCIRQAFSSRNVFPIGR